MKRWIATLLVLCLMLPVFSGCDAAIPESDAVSIVTTVFPLYDWARELVGDTDGVTVTLLTKGVDLHSYQPTAKDMVTIADCDLFLYVGGESDDWVEDALANDSNPDRCVCNLLETLGTLAKEEETVEGMEAEEEEEEEAYDEHIWLSLKNAQVLCAAIADALAEVDAANADTYEQNATDYINKLSALDAEYEEMVSAAPKNTVLFADRFPFRYLVDDYGLSYYAAFPGCSSETEASFETVAFLAEKAEELQLSYLIILEDSDGELAETIANTMESGTPETVTVHSMQSVTTDEIESGMTYLSVMEENLEAFRQALS